MVKLKHLQSWQKGIIFKEKLIFCRKRILQKDYLQTKSYFHDKPVIIVKIQFDDKKTFPFSCLNINFITSFQMYFYYIRTSMIMLGMNHGLFYKC
jgi:hypothetical protein